MCGHVRIEDSKDDEAVPRSGRRFSPIVSGARELEKAIDLSTRHVHDVHVPKWGNHRTYSELQTRSGRGHHDVRDVPVMHKWSFEG
jgi:hypothetical protein